VTLAPGNRLGPYVIQFAIGAGGMGEVYRATDTNLGRDVAIKVLPEVFAEDPERIAPFEREAKTLASLNHPNIAIIHWLEKSHGTYALVMELVEGEDLSQRIARSRRSTTAPSRIGPPVAMQLTGHETVVFLGWPFADSLYARGRVPLQRDNQLAAAVHSIYQALPPR